jgi:hypothetical protein
LHDTGKDGMYDLRDMITQAQRGHSYVAPAFRSSPIILRKPDQHIYHQLGKKGRDNSFDPESAFEKWLYYRDHYGLDALLSHGFVPDIHSQLEEYSEAADHGETMKRAADMGYTVKREWLDSRKASYGESEALVAARRLLTGCFDCFDKAFWDTARTMPLRVNMLTGSFPIPKSNEPGTIAYIADQLWLTSAEQGIRKVVLEIDGEQHLGPDRFTSDCSRDARMTELGYEVYRVAAWWARVDPYRVIAEFLDISGILPEASRYILGCFDGIDEYRCAECGELMVRWDIDWIQHNRVGKACHAACI